MEPVEPPVVQTPPIDDADNVIVETPSTEPVPVEPAEPPIVPSVPEYENAWPIGLDEAAAVIAELWEDGTFVVDGAGDTLAFESAGEVPWLAAGVAKDIKRVVFADAVEPASLAHWFEGCANLEEVANVPTGTKDVTRLFFDCPNLVELPDDFALASGAKAEEAFGFEALPAEPLETAYSGTDERVLAYAWELDGRMLVNPLAPEPPPIEEPTEPEGPQDPQAPEGEPADGPTETPAEDPVPEEQPADEPVEAPVEEPLEPAPAPVPESPQVNITVPSVVTMSVGVDGTQSAIVPVTVENRSERDVAIVGARLKRADMDLPGGTWSLSTQNGLATFVTDARFTPLGLEVSFDTPVVLRSGGACMDLVWYSEFSDFDMKQLLAAVADAGDAGFTYGSMIWIVAAA